MVTSFQGMSTAVTGDLGPMAPKPLEEANGGALQEADRFERSSANVDQNLIRKVLTESCLPKILKKIGKVLTKIKDSTSAYEDPTKGSWQRQKQRARHLFSF